MTSRYLLIATEDATTMRTASDVQRVIAAQGITCDGVSVASASDLSSAVLRAGRARTSYDACIVLGAVEPSMEAYVAQNINNAAVAVFLPVVIALGGSRDPNAIVARAVRLATVGGPAGGDTGLAPIAPSTAPAAASRRTVGPLASAASSSMGGGAGSPWSAVANAAPAPLAPSVLGSTMPPAAIRTKRTDFTGASPVTGMPSAYTGMPAPTMAAAPAPAYAAGRPRTTYDAPSDAVFGGSKGAAGLYTADDAVRSTLYILRESLIKYGGKGIAAVGRRFAVSDADGSRALDLDEFKRGLRQIGVTLPEDDIKRLFAYFDRAGTGQIDYDEFLVGLRGELSPRRKAIVDEAFRALDVKGNGFVITDDLVGRFDASKHPDVISGRAKPERILRDFLDGFDGGVRDGRVLPIEFERYYAALSAYIDDDDYFELMMRNCWHLSGGTGVTENTTNRRVLVTHRDGHQSVEEVPNDLAAGNNIMLIKRALATRGVEAAEVSLYGGGAESSSLGSSLGGSDSIPISPLRSSSPPGMRTSSIAMAAAERKAVLPGGALRSPDRRLGMRPAGIAQMMPREYTDSSGSVGERFGEGLGSSPRSRPGKRLTGNVKNRLVQFSFG